MTSKESGKIKTVIFDLDGTLIDSAPSIICGLEIVLKKAGCVPVFPLNQSIVGPPLRETLQKLVGNQTNDDLEKLVVDFKSYYDSEGYKNSVLYPGVQMLLNELVQLGISIYLATNKRLHPTEKILDHFGWTSLFDEIYAIDKFTDAPFLNKTSMIKALIQAESIDIKHAIYVGDRVEDFDASSASGLETILVDWGYGQFEIASTEGVQYASSTKDLHQMIVSRG